MRTTVDRVYKAPAQTTAADPLTGRLLEGRYRLQYRLARGGMSTVYAALDERLDRLVAVKIMAGSLSADPAFADRFAREARVAAKLSHLNVVSVYDQGSDRGEVFLVMELVTGRTLRDLIREYGPLPQALAVSIMEPVLGALAAAHRAGLVHRDIKPENILLSDDGVVKVADFGLARAVDADASSTRTGLMMGTVAYCSPEQIAHGYADTRSDVYAAGVVLFELLTGGVPFVGENAMAVAYQHVHSRVPAASARVPGVDSSIDELIVRATDNDPQLRPLDAAAMLAELHDIRSTLRLPVVPIPLRTRTIPNAHTDFRAAGYPVGDARTQHVGLSADEQRTQQLGSANQPEPVTTWIGAGEPPTGLHHTAVAAFAPPDVASANPVVATSRKPKSERKRRRRTLIVLVVIALIGAAVGYGTWWLAAGRFTALPDVTGASQASATQTLQHAGFTHLAPVTAYSETVAKGTVISTDPGPGERLLPAHQVKIVVSSGRERYTVPTVGHDSNETAARAALSAVKAGDGSSALQVVVTQQSDDSVPQGHVIGTNPTGGTAVKRNTLVTIIISSGLPVLAVPDVGGQSQSAATAALTQAGFKVTVGNAYSNSVTSGQVISQNPAAASQAVKFSSVTITVSQGPEYINIPSVNDESSEAATQALTQAGFKVTVNRIFGGQLDRVIHVSANSSDLNSSGQAHVGATITIDVA